MKPFDLDEHLKKPFKGGGDERWKKSNTILGCIPVVAQIEGLDQSDTFYKNGRYLYYRETSRDLFFAPEKT